MRDNSNKDEEQPYVEFKDYNNYSDFAAKFRVEEQSGQQFAIDRNLNVIYQLDIIEKVPRKDIKGMREYLDELRELSNPKVL